MSDCDCDDRIFWEGIIASKKAALTALYARLTSLATDGAQSYSLDTGQTRQVVTSSGPTELRNSISRLESEITALQARLYGCGRFYGRPAW